MFNKVYQFLKGIARIILPEKIRALISYSDHVVSVRHRRHLRAVHIEKEKVVLPVIVFNFSFGCNLKCEHCGTFSPYRSGLVPKEELLESFDLWSQKIQPVEIHVSGGEPFLHPDIKEVVIHLKKAWPHANLMIISNGLLLPNISDDVFQTLAGLKVKIRISKHFSDKKHEEILNNVTHRLTTFGIQNWILDSTVNWLVYYPLDDRGLPIPSRSNPKAAWSRCYIKYNAFILGHHLWRCSGIGEIQHGIQNGCLTSPEWLPALNHHAVSCDQSVQDILQYLHLGVIPECTLCREDCVYIKPCQISPQKLKEIQSLLAKDNQNSK
ncbi:MAG: radical SAM protein [Planctomycetaceae bacterium]|jgi:uncharacterized Fe-S cluster-containing radical SAM superfamily protein|nr:radical SAM protein [Planctomycetaceae bacterium]